MNKYIKVLLLITIVLFSNTSVSEAISSNEILDSKVYNGDPQDNETLYYKYLNASDKDGFVDNIMNFLTVEGSNSIDSKNYNYGLNPYVYIKYKSIAYTDDNAIDKGLAGLTEKGGMMRYTTPDYSEDEYRYLGYNYAEESLITNDFYPMDSKTVSDPTTRKYIAKDSNLKTWQEIAKNLSRHMLFTPVLNDDLKEGVFSKTRYSISDMTGKDVIDELKRFAKLTQPPSFGQPGIMVLNHMVNGVVWYDTVRIEEFVLGLSSEITVDQTKYIVTPEDETVRIYFTVRPYVRDIKTDGQSKDGRYIKEVEITPNTATTDNIVFDNKELNDVDLPPLLRTFYKDVDVRGLALDKEMTVDLAATTVVTLENGHVKMSRAEKQVTVKKKEKPEAVVDFVILQEGRDITGKIVYINSTTFSEDTLYALVDTSFIPDELGEVTQHLWQVELLGEWVTLDAGNLSEYYFNGKELERMILTNNDEDNYNNDLKKEVIQLANNGLLDGKNITFDNALNSDTPLFVKVNPNNPHTDIGDSLLHEEYVFTGDLPDLGKGYRLTFKDVTERKNGITINRVWSYKRNGRWLELSKGNDEQIQALILSIDELSKIESEDGSGVYEIKLDFYISIPEENINKQLKVIDNKEEPIKIMKTLEVVE